MLIRYKKYIYNYLALLIVVIIIIISFNIFMNSYYTNRPFMALQKQPSSLIIGTSTLNFGIDPYNQNIINENYYSIPVGGIKNKLTWIKIINSLNKLDNVILGLDYFEFNYYRNVDEINKGDILNNKFSILINLIKELTSIDSFLYSLRKYFGFSNEIVLENGHVWLNDYTGIHTFSGLKHDELETYLPAPNKSFIIHSPDKTLDKLDYLNQIIDYCNNNEINLRMIIPPRHISLFEIEKHLGLDIYFEKWKIALVTLVLENNNNNNNSSNKSLELWDFSNINSITAEKLPIQGKQNMKWFRDRIHFKKEFGDLVLDTIFNNNEANHNIGTKINIDNINEHLNYIRDNYKNYSLINSELIETIKTNMSKLLNKNAL